MGEVVSIAFSKPVCSNVEDFLLMTRGYRFGFNGKELDKDGMGGGGSIYDYGFRIYNPQIAKFLSVDPLTKEYPMLTPYQFASNSPISGIDLDGLEYVHYIMVFDNNGGCKITITPYNKNEPRMYGSKGPGVMYSIGYYGGGGKKIAWYNEFVARAESLPWYAKPFTNGFNYKDYGLYMGPTSLFKHDFYGFTRAYQYDITPIDAVDAAARMHDMRYDKVGAVGQDALFNDWRVLPADMEAVKSWNQILTLGVGGIDPYNCSPITETEIAAAKNAVTLFNYVIYDKMSQITNWMVDNNIIGAAKAESRLDITTYFANYNLFLSMYMDQNSDGSWSEKQEMWKDGKPIPPSN